MPTPSTLSAPTAVGLANLCSMRNHASPLQATTIASSSCAAFAILAKTSAAIVVSRSSSLCKLHFRLSEHLHQAERKADGKIVATC